jgi:hypothetical protein
LRNLNRKNIIIHHSMNTSVRSNPIRAAVVLLLAILASVQLAQAQTLSLQLMATNYNPTTGLWTATVGPNAQAGGTFPTLNASASPNGAPAVVFNGANYLTLASSIATANGYTALAYIKPATGAGPYALFGGASGSFEYRIYNSKQDALKQQTTDLGSETTTMSTSAFSLIDCTVTNVGGGSFRLNGVADGNNSASSFTQPLSAIGARSSGTGVENFSGSICEIDIYTGVLTLSQITNIEAALTAAYVTPPPTAPLLVANTAANPAVATVGGSDTLSAAFTGAAPISYQWQLSANASGSGAVSILGASNTTLVLNNLQLSNSGYYYSLLASNAVAPYVSNSSWLQLEVVPLTAAVQLAATNYNPATGVWTDSSGNNNNATYSGGYTPTLVSFVTPNGGSAVNITANESQYFLLSSSLAYGSGYTVFAYVMPSVVSDGNRHSLTGGSASDALEYDFYSGHQDYLLEYVADEGHGTATIPTTSFSLVDLAVNSSGAAFRFNGASDGNVAGVAFTAPLARIGNNHGGGDGFFGDIAEIDIYTGVLTSNQISTVEAQLTASYVTAGSIVIGAATVAPANNTYAGNPITLSAPVIGATGTTTFHWQTDNGTGGASFANISGATSTNYALNTSSLLGTYEYQLIGTPFGGSSVTSAPVSLTVQAASAPVVLVDTTPNPANATVAGNETFSASFTGNLPIGYQWQVSANASGSGAVNIPGATNGTLLLTNLQLTNSGGYYSLRATNNISPYVANSSWAQLTVVPLTASVQLIATNYDPSGGAWTDSSGNGNNATYSGLSTPTLVSFVTLNGGSAVSIASSENQAFFLSSPLDPGSGFTVFAYVMPSAVSDGNRHALTGGSSSGALEYDFYNGHQDYLREYLQDVGNGTAAIPTANFSLVDLAVNSSGAAFRLNGAPDATAAGATFGSALTRIGNNEGGGDGFFGEIAEIDIFTGVLSSIQISNIEAQFIAKYVTISSIVIGPATVAPTNITYAGNAVTLAAPVIGAIGSSSFNWQTDNGSGGASFSNIAGATNTNYVLNTTALLGTYEYQLVGTPFGGSSVTSAPVTLTVQAASAPVVLVDITPNPATATIGGNETFSASFAGTLPIGYQWQVSANSSGSGAVNIQGATNTALLLTDLQLTNSGNYYSLRATNNISPYVANSSWAQLTVEPLTALVQLMATNYDPVAGVWTDSSGNGNNATYAGVNNPTLISVVTPNGGSAVDIATGDGSFLLSSPLVPSLGYTVFAYVLPSVVAGRNALTGGSSSGALEYDFYNGHQDYLREYLQDVGNGKATIPTNNFSLVDLAVNSSGAAFRLNGASDASVAGATFGSALTRIGNNEGGGDGFVGEIAEIDIYSGVLSSIQISNIEAQLTTNYGAIITVATNPPTITAMVSGNQLYLSWPADHTGWLLQVQTNNLNQGVSENPHDWMAVPGSTATDHTNFTITPSPQEEFYRLVYP